MKTAIFSKKLVQKKVLIPAILGVGILLSAALVAASPLENLLAQQQQQWSMNRTTDASQYGTIPKINGSVNVGDGIKNFFAENAKTPFITGAQTAQDQIANGTVVGGHIGVTQGYLTYTYLVVDPTNDIARKVVIDAGNGQVLYTSEGKQVGSLDQSMFESFGQGRVHEGFGGGGGGFGPFGHGFGPFGSGGGFGPFGGFWHNK
ncbi:MAG: hypothetical protein WBP83_06630 [Nitrososphaeraceae archaeon]|jgi:hypothetical protein